MNEQSSRGDARVRKKRRHRKPNRGQFQSKLNEEMKSQILGVLRLGCSRLTAALCVGCCYDTIRRTANRDPKFKKDLVKAEAGFEVFHAKKIHEGDQAWRASGWALERKIPSRYGLRKPGTMSIQDVAGLLREYADVIASEVTNPSTRHRIIRRLQGILIALESQNYEGVLEKCKS